MNIMECGALLAQVAAYDHRDVDEVIIAAWLDVIGDLPYADARDSVLAHYRESRDRLMPADVRTRVKAVRAARLAATPLPSGAPSDPAEYDRWLTAERKKIADGPPTPLALEGR